jgi:DNA repair exonuclease SbcCD ATPase subunit
MTKAGDLKDKFNVNIRHNVKGTDNHKLLSGGEKRLIDLCCMKSLRSLSERLYNKKFHNYFLDETTDSLDADSCNSFCQMLRMLSKDQNVAIITHNDPENMEPDRVFKM